MGVLRNQRSTSKNHPAARGYRKKRLARKVYKKNHGETTGDVVDAAIMPKSVLKKRRTSPKTNITLSGKKKHKLLKQIRRQQKQKSAMETTTEDKTTAAKPAEEEEVKIVKAPGRSKKSKKHGKGKKAAVKDVEMMEDDC